MINRRWIGAFLIFLGIGFFFQQLNIFGFSSFIAQWWPIIFILVGIVQLISNPRNNFLIGIIFILLGVIILGNQFIDINLFTILWPIFLILIGLTFIIKRGKIKPMTDSSDVLQNFTLFGGNNIKNRSQNFKGGEITTIFGGAQIDLTQIAILNEAHLELTCIFGGITIIVPDNINIVITGTPVFGGWEDKTNYSNNIPATTLSINCFPLFGGIEIKN